MSKQEAREMIADKGRKKKQRGAESTLSRLRVISENIRATASSVDLGSLFSAPL